MAHTPGATLKTCVVAYATPERQHLWTVELPQGATVADAIEAARRLEAARSLGAARSVETARRPEGEDTPSTASNPEPGAIPWDSAPVGIFGELRTRDHVPEDGDRIELYRPLKDDPRERRRQRVRQARKR